MSSFSGAARLSRAAAAVTAKTIGKSAEANRKVEVGVLSVSIELLLRIGIVISALLFLFGFWQQQQQQRRRRRFPAVVCVSPRILPLRALSSPSLARIGGGGDGTCKVKMPLYGSRTSSHRLSTVAQVRD